MPIAKAPKPATAKQVTPGKGIGNPDAGAELPPPRRVTVKSVHDIASMILQILLVISVVVGGYQYLLLREAERVNQSLGFVSLWESEGFREDLSFINAAIATSFQLARPQIQAAEGDDQLIAAMLANLGDRVTGADAAFDTELEQKIERIFYFFDRAAICAENAICENRVMRSFLGEQAGDFWRYFSSYARRKRDAGYNGYGDWTERFASSSITEPKFWIFF